MKKDLVVDFCKKCTGPMVRKNITHELPNDTYANFLVVKKYVCKWCGKERAVDIKWK